MGIRSRTRSFPERPGHYRGERDALWRDRHVQWNYVNIGIEQETYIETAEEYANKALALNSQSAEGHFVLGPPDLACRGDQRAAVEWEAFGA